MRESADLVATCINVSMLTAVPHLAMEDVEYKGYQIPKDSIVMANTWYNIRTFPSFSDTFISPRSILHDADRYPDPMAFKPQRYLGIEDVVRTEDSKYVVNEDPARYIFGFGPR